MLTLTYTESGFSANMEISENSLKNPNSNAIVNIVCEPPIILNELELMDKACNYINSFIDFNIMTDHVIVNIKEKIDTEYKEIYELAFQIYWKNR